MIMQRPDGAFATILWAGHAMSYTRDGSGSKVAGAPNEEGKCSRMYNLGTKNRVEGKISVR